MKTFIKFTENEKNRVLKAIERNIGTDRGVMKLVQIESDGESKKVNGLDETLEKTDDILQYCQNEIDKKTKYIEDIEAGKKIELDSNIGLFLFSIAFHIAEGNKLYEGLNIEDIDFFKEAIAEINVMKEGEKKIIIDFNSVINNYLKKINRDGCLIIEKTDDSDGAYAVCEKKNYTDNFDCIVSRFETIDEAIEYAGTRANHWIEKYFSN